MSDSLKYFSLTTIFVLMFSMGHIELSYAQNDPELIAKSLFENGEYEQALPYFKDLVNLYPKDELLNYYLAACQVETKKISEDTKTALQNAFGDNTPAKIFYYQAQVFHAENNFEMADNFYQRFQDEAKRKTVKATRANELQKLAQQQINPFPKPIPVKITEVESTTESIKAAIPPSAPKPAQKTFEVPLALKDSIINFQVTPSIRYLQINQFKNELSTQAFVESWLIEQKIKSLLYKTNNLRSRYASTEISEKQDLAETILQLESETYELNQQVNSLYAEAREREIGYWDNAQSDEVRDFILQINLMEDSIDQAKIEERKKNVSIVVPLELPDKQEQSIAPTDTPVQNNQVVYKIQIGAYRSSPPDWVQQLFKKLAMIRKIDQYTDNNGVTVYTVGELSSFSDALQMQSQVRQEGVKDAFVAAYKNGDRISVKEARKISENLN